jgi:hypothetical protein
MAKRAVVMEPEERKLHTLMQRVSTIRNDKAEKRKEMQAARKKILNKKIAKNDEGKVQVCVCVCVLRFVFVFCMRGGMCLCV